VKKRLFIVDDDSSVRDSLKKVLEESGYEVATACGGAEASQLDRARFDLMILDVDMPIRDGWDVLEELRETHPLVPVVLITGMYDHLDTTVIPGIRALLRKPVETPLLLTTVEALLSESPEERLSRINQTLDRVVESFSQNPNCIERFTGYGRGPRWRY